MTVSLLKKRIRGHAYWYARECQRVKGKPKIVWQKYLGKADTIAAAVGARTPPARPQEIVLGDFGALAALYDLTQQLELIPTIDRHAGKRTQGVSVGTYLTLAALNRCVAPTSKAQLADWYQQTVLRRLLPVPPRDLTSQRFWDHLSYLDAAKISAIEQDLTRRVIERFQLDLSCLLYDTTNFATFIDTFNEAPTLAQRGKSKEKRADLRIVGLALLVTQDFHIPLVHHVYPGNAHDAPTFASLTDTLVARYRLFADRIKDITLVYDKGNNSADNQAHVDASPYHYVGGLCPTQHPDLLRIPRTRFQPLAGDDLEGVLAHRTRIRVLGAERTVLLTYNPALFLTQSATILREVQKRTRKLRDLQHALAHPPATGKPRTVEGVRTQLQGILTGRHMAELIHTQVTAEAGRLRLHYQMDQAAWARLQRTLLGKTLLFTDQEEWTDEAIVRAYRGQHHIEEAFKRMKCPRFVSWRPLYHWTDQKIRVHAFYCVLALLLTSLLRRILAQRGLPLSIVNILETLSQIKEVALIYRDPRRPPRPIITYNRLTPLQQRLIKALDLQRFQST